MFGKFSEDAQKILILSKKEMCELKHENIGSEHLLLSILKNDNEIKGKLKKYNVTYKNFKKELLNLVPVGNSTNTLTTYTSLMKRILENLIIDSKETKEEITPISLFLALLNEGEGTAVRILLYMGVDINRLYSDISNTRKINKKKKRKLSIDDLTIDLTKKAKDNELDPVFNRENEINRVIEILSRRYKNNPILIGPAGTGKTAIVEELSRKIAKGDVPINLKNKRVLSLDMASAVSGTKYRGEFEERIKKIINELEDNEDIIVFIDEIHTLVGAGGAEGAIDASNIFKPSLSRGKIKVIGATTIDEYKKYIEKDGALERRFQKVLINEPKEEDLKNILLNLKPIYEDYHNVKIDNNIIDNIQVLSDKYIYDRYEPDKSIDILDEVCTKVSLKEIKEEKTLNKLYDELNKIKKNKNDAIINQNYEKAYSLKEKEQFILDNINNIKLKLIRKNKRKKVKIEDVLDVISSKTKIPVYELKGDIKKQVKLIEKNLYDNVIGQDNAINKLIEITKKIKLDMKDKNKSYSLLFCGPTGVGKTYLAKLFGNNLVGNNVIKLDMSEYSESISINKIIGSPAGYIGYDDNKNILEEIRNKPYSVLILDEIEKAHKTVINFFLNILEEGKCKDSKGTEIRFDNVLIIMTSNVYSSKESVGFNSKKEDILKEYFPKEFINRIDEIVIFNKLEKEDINKILSKEVNRINKKYNKKYNKKEILTKEDINNIIDNYDYNEYGVRKLCKIIKKEIENKIITKVFS